MKKTWMCALALAAALNFSNTEAAYTPPKVPEDIFQWVQSSERMNYFFNKKEIMGNKYGTPNPVPFRVVDKNIGLDVDISIRCHGEYSYRISDPMLFYKNVCGNVEYEYKRSQIDSQLKYLLTLAAEIFVLHLQ